MSKAMSAVLTAEQNERLNQLAVEMSDLCDLCAELESLQAHALRRVEEIDNDFHGVEILMGCKRCSRPRSSWLRRLDDWEFHVAQEVCCCTASRERCSILLRFVSSTGAREGCTCSPSSCPFLMVALLAYPELALVQVLSFPPCGRPFNGNGHSMSAVRPVGLLRVRNAN
jgi:hypothetical protein